MARSGRTNLIGNILQKVGRTLSGNTASGSRSGGKSFSGTSRSSGRSTKRKSGAETLLRRLLR